MKRIISKLYKSKIFLLSFLTIIIFSDISCRKYPDGPSVSLRSRSARVANTWRVDKYFRNSIDETGNFITSRVNYTEDFTKNGTWSYNYLDNNNKLKSGGGSWVFIQNDTEIQLINGNSVSFLNILRLKENEFWFWYIEDGDIKEFHMIPF